MNRPTATAHGFRAEVIEHSVSPLGKELITFQLRYPRIIHAEAKTHRILSQSSEEIVVHEANIALMDDRALSRNASSSRAIPVAKFIEQVRNDPAMPVHWGKNQPGMQARAELTGAELMVTKQAWRDAAFFAAQQAEIMMNAGAHKQVANRPLEPFQWMSVIVSATETANFYELRDHEDADPNICLLARLMREVHTTSRPILRDGGGMTAMSWHLPYITLDERLAFMDAPRTLAQASGARCARVSFLNHDGTAPVWEKDLDLYTKLVGSRPLHASPVEHQGFPADAVDEQYGNFFGWVQHRKLVEEEVWATTATA